MSDSAGALAAPAAAGSLHLACVEAEGRVYGIDVMQIREIVHTQEVTPLPTAPPLIEGVIDLRGSTIPVIDLGRVLHGAPADETERTRIVVLEIGALVVGLRVEAAVDVLAADPASVESPPALVTEVGYEAMGAVVRQRDASPVLVLSCEHLLARVEASARGAAPGEPSDR